jgi:hypothetical protein
MRSRLATLALVLILSALSAGCIDGIALKQFGALDVRNEVLKSNDLVSLMRHGGDAGKTVAGAALVLLCLYLGFRAHQGQPWLGLAKECFVGGIVCAFVLSTYTLPSGPVRGLANIGWDLYAQTTKERGLFDVLAPVVARSARTMTDAHGLVERIVDLALRQRLEAFLYRWSQPFWASLYGANVLAIFVLRQILLAVYSFLIAFYWVLTPYVAWTVVLPQTRHVFRGFVQSYVAVCLWPLFLGVTERLMTSLPWESWVGGASSSAPAALMSQWNQGQLVIFSMNTVFLAAIAAIPVVASKTVSGAIRASIQ